jgi:hypothetical protein
MKQAVGQHKIREYTDANGRTRFASSVDFGRTWSRISRNDASYSLSFHGYRKEVGKNPFAKDAK